MGGGGGCISTSLSGKRLTYFNLTLTLLHTRYHLECSLYELLHHNHCVICQILVQGTSFFHFDRCGTPEKVLV